MYVGIVKRQEIQRQEDSNRLHESIKRQEERFGKILECFTKQNDPGNLNIFSQETVINSVGEFIYKQEEVTFDAFFRRCKSIFEKYCEKWPHGKKMRLLLGKFGAAEHIKYVNFILLKHTGEVTFQETIQILTKIFGEQSLILVGNVST